MLLLIVIISFLAYLSIYSCQKIVSKEHDDIKTMSSRTVSVILFLLVFISNGCSFSKLGKIRQSGDEHVYSTAIHYNPLKDSNVTVDPHCDCSSSTFKVMRIPYNCAVSTCGKLHVDLSSACVRCSMCTVVAEEVRLTINLLVKFLYIYSIYKYKSLILY